MTLPPFSPDAADAPGIAPDGLRVRAALVSLVIGTALLGVKYVAYVYTGSSAILSDALESIINVVAALFAVFGLRFASQPPDQGHPYGHGKIEYFSAVFEGGLIAFAAVLWGFLDVSAQILDINDIPKEIVTIMQGIIVLAVVIAYEVVRRWRLASEQRHVAAQLAGSTAAAVA